VGVADLSIERLSPQDFLKDVLTDIEELDDRQRELLLAASGAAGRRSEALQAAIETVADDA